MPEPITATADVSAGPPPATDVSAGPPPAAAETTETRPPEALVEQELLVEDVSIDGMCGVY